MTTTTTQIRARRSNFLRDVVSVAGRALRAVPRDMEALIPAIAIPVFFFIVNVGALQDQTERFLDIDYKAFQLPVAIIFAVTGVSRAITVVTDIQSGYFDKLSLTPVNRLAMLLGFTIADFALVVILSIPVIALGFIVGVRFETGLAGLLMFVVMAGCWGLAYAGFPYAIALKTGNPAAVTPASCCSSRSCSLPRCSCRWRRSPDGCRRWRCTTAVTYLLAGLRSLISVGWDPEALGRGFASIAVVGAVSFTLALVALRGPRAPALVDAPVLPSPSRERVRVRGNAGLPYSTRRKPGYATSSGHRPYQQQHSGREERIRRADVHGQETQRNHAQGLDAERHHTQAHHPPAHLGRGVHLHDGHGQGHDQ